MHKVVIYSILAASATLAGCAAPLYTKPGATEADFQRDKAACWYDGQKATAGNPNMFAGLETVDLARQCLALKGWSQVSSGAPKSAAPTKPQVAVIRAPGQTAEELTTIIKQCEQSAVDREDTMKCLKRNHLIVMPEIEFSGYVQKAVASGAIKQENLKNGRPASEADKLAVDALVWKDYGVHE